MAEKLTSKRCTLGDSISNKREYPGSQTHIPMMQPIKALRQDLESTSTKEVAASPNPAMARET